MLDLKEKELKVQKIKNGTVIDHIAAGYALSVLRILGITGKEGITVSVCLLYTSPSPRDISGSRMPSSA